jgi:hypothetical protein
MTPDAPRARRFRRLRSLLRREEGSVTIEFLIWFPTFFLVFLWAVDGAILLTKSTMFERAVDIAMRDVRLNIDAPITEAKVRDRICQNAAFVGNCEDRLVLAMQRISMTTWGPLPNTVSCSGRDDGGNFIKPPTDFTPGGPNELMIVRACAVVNMIIPFASGWGLPVRQDNFGGTYLIAVSAFANEPS